MTTDEMPNPDDFAAYLNGITDRIAEEVRDEAFDRAVMDAKRIVTYAAELRQAAVTAGFSTSAAESMALDFWGIASGIRDE
ncbi:hypothetical protein [Streptomyces sp. NPDC051162]|uniref:hypothetical protein n=1 Tax=Streptomyces sp. NPDC051162 TaxID=3154747 RepID=UPI00342D4A00